MKKMGLIVTLVLLLVVTASIVVSTYAQYATSVTGEDTARVAKFSFELNGTEAASATPISLPISLFADSYLSNYVVGESGAKVVAPGTSGYVNISLKNTGEVEIVPVWTITEQNVNNIPLVYAVTTSASAPASGEWKSAAALSVSSVSLPVGSNAQEFYLHWKWDTSSDVADTSLGTTGTATVKVTVGIAITQKTS